MSVPHASESRAASRYAPRSVDPFAYASRRPATTAGVADNLYAPRSSAFTAGAAEGYYYPPAAEGYYPPTTASYAPRRAPTTAAAADSLYAARRSAVDNAMEAYYGARTAAAADSLYYGSSKPRSHHSYAVGATTAGMPKPLYASPAPSRPAASYYY